MLQHKIPLRSHRRGYRRNSLCSRAALLGQVSESLDARSLLAAVTSLSPMDGAKDVAVDTNLVMNFDQNVHAGSGDILIKRLADNSVYSSLNVHSAAVTFSGQQVTIDLPGDLVNSTDYFVQADPNAILDQSNFPAVFGPFTWRFSTLTDLAVVPFWNADATFPTAESATYNLLGGPVVESDNVIVSRDTNTIRGGSGAIRADVSVSSNDFGFFGPALAGFGVDNSYVDTRDLTAFESLKFQFKNQTGEGFTLRLELKDYRDLSGEGNSHRASTSFPISADNQWQSLEVPLDLSNARWDVTGSPDLSQARQLLFVIEATEGSAVGGAVFLDEVNLVEAGGPVVLTSVTDQQIVESLAERSFRSLWGTRDRATGLLPAISTFADQMSLNTTALLVRALPGAIKQGWVGVAQAEAYVTTLVATLNNVMDDSVYLPPRTLDRVSLEPIGLREESSVDAAFMFLGLTTFSAADGISTGTRSNITSLLDRFDFQPFSSANGWRFAFRYDDGARTGQLTDGTYDGYSGEIYVISLAAHLAGSGPVDIRQQFHSGNRVLAELGNGNASYLVHPSAEFRSPFLQWLFPLFVDVENRGPTNYPTSDHAINPYVNAVRYQRDVNETLASLGVPLQRDAADDGSGGRYITPSAFDDVGEPALTMPWSAGFSLAADPAAAVESLKLFAQSGLLGPFGPVDTARFDLQTGSATQFNGRADLWNSALFLSAAMEYLYDDNALLSQQAAVSSALDLVFGEASQPFGNVDGDADFDANDSFLIHLVKLAGSDAQIDQSKGSSSLSATQIRTNVDLLSTAGDVDGDGDFDANDSFLIHLVKLAGSDSQIDQSKGSSSLSAVQIRANVDALNVTGTRTFTAARDEVLNAVQSQTFDVKSALPGRRSSSEPEPLFAEDPETSILNEMLALSFSDSGETPAVEVWTEYREWIDLI